MARKKKQELKQKIYSLRYPIVALAIILLALIVVFSVKNHSGLENNPPKITGISKEEVDIGPSIETSESEEIDRFTKHMRSADKVESFWFKVNDTGVNTSDEYMYLGRYGKILVEEPSDINGETYDWIYFERLNKVALARCSRDYCGEVDYSVDSMDYEELYYPDPVEWMYQFKDAEFVNESMMGQNIVEIFDAKTLDDIPARLWLQQYYGVPLKIEIYSKEPRTIIFEDLKINQVRLGHVMLPFNFTVDGTPYEAGWYGYLAKEFDEPYPE